MRNLGPASARMLAAVGIETADQLRKLGAVRAYLRVAQRQAPSLNLLYAIEGALSDRAWTDVARRDKARLLNELHATAQSE